MQARQNFLAQATLRRLGQGGEGGESLRWKPCAGGGEGPPAQETLRRRRTAQYCSFRKVPLLSTGSPGGSTLLTSTLTTPRRLGCSGACCLLARTSWAGAAVSSRLPTQGSRQKAIRHQHSPLDSGCLQTAGRGEKTRVSWKAVGIAVYAGQAVRREVVLSSVIEYNLVERRAKR